MKFIDKDLLSIQEARILLENAKVSKQIISQYSQEKLDEVVSSFYDEISKKFKDIAKLSVNETGYGNFPDEYNQLQTITSLIFNEIKDKRYIGTLKVDNKDNILEYGMPKGTILVICPEVNPATSVINIILNGIKTGNNIIFAPMKRSCNTVKSIVKVFENIGKEFGVSEGVVSTLNEITKKGIDELIESNNIDLIINFESSNERFNCKYMDTPQIYSVSGASPVFIERTANINNSVKSVLNSRKYNNGILPGAEQFVVVDSIISDKVKQEMELQGAYFMNSEEENSLIDLLIKNGRMDKEYIGKSAWDLAKSSGFIVPDNTCILVSEQRYISDFNPYSTEIKGPVIAFYVENDWMNGCEKCMELLFESRGSTLAIHSENNSIIEQFIVKKPVSRILVNAGASLGATGISTDLFPTVVLGGLTSGLGYLEGNLEPKDLIYIRKVGYGKEYDICKDDNNLENRDDLKNILENILKKLNEG